MALEERQRLFVIITLILTLVALGLMVGSFATDNWIKATGNKPNDTALSYNSSNIPYMNASFGLFYGSRTINYGNGARQQNITVVCESKYCFLFNSSSSSESDKRRDKLEEVISIFNNQTGEMYRYGLFPFSLWVVVLIMSALGMIWGLVYIGFAIFNICGKPIETITGPWGLYLWKGLALLFSLLGMVVYLVLYFQYYKKSVLPWEDQLADFVSQADLDFSFYMLMVAVILFLLNLGFLFLSGIKFSCGFTREAEKVMDNGIILY